MLEKFSKPSADILKIKGRDFEQNDALHRENVRIAEIYAAQPRRERCKNCNAPIAGRPLFRKLGIDYHACARCEHVNGAHDDTEAFVHQLYVQEEGAYAKAYASESNAAYLARVEAVYRPKAEFLLECLRAAGEEPSTLSYCDFGAGSGYLVHALRKGCGLANVTGIDVGATQVALANEMLGESLVELEPLGEPHARVASTTSNVLTLIGVLEHLRDPRGFLEAARANANVRYLYLSLPMFSFSVFFELLNQDLYQRHLASGHTHLYTERSLDWICKDVGFERVGQWSFGTDMVDLFRFASVRLHKLGFDDARELFASKLAGLLDEMQAAMDRSGFCSETHVLLKKSAKP
jgi:hypothetical protein